MAMTERSPPMRENGVRFLVGTDLQKSLNQIVTDSAFS